MVLLQSRVEGRGGGGGGVIKARPKLGQKDETVVQ